MTSVKSMLAMRVFALAALLALVSGCASKERLEPPPAHASPFPGETRVWAVAPFGNESGVSRIDAAHMADLFAQEVEQVDGLRIVPVNRVLSAMSLLKMPAITSESDAMAVLHLLGVDGLIAGTITTYDGFQPLKLGLAVQLFARPDRDATLTSLDPRTISRGTVGELDGPTQAIESIIASGLFDASNHATREQLALYAAGRTAPESAYGERLYLVSMDLYTRFVSHRLIGDLLAGERARLAGVSGAGADLNQPPD